MPTPTSRNAIKIYIYPCVRVYVSACEHVTRAKKKITHTTHIWPPIIITSKQKSCTPHTAQHPQAHEGGFRRNTACKRGGVEEGDGGGGWYGNTGHFYDQPMFLFFSRFCFYPDKTHCETQIRQDRQTDERNKTKQIPYNIDTINECCATNNFHSHIGA